MTRTKRKPARLASKAKVAERKSPAISKLRVVKNSISKEPPATIEDDLKIGFTFSPALKNLRAGRVRLLEMAQAEMEFAIEFARRLAGIRSPFEMPLVFAEFTKRRIAMTIGALTPVQ